MKIVHLCPSAAFGGTEAVAETLHKLGQRAGWNSQLMLPISRDALAPPVRWCAWACSQRIEADVVHAHLPWPDRLGVARIIARRLPLVVTFHLLPQGKWPRDKVTKLPSRWLLRLSAQRSRTQWVALSQHDRGVLTAMLGAGVHVVRNAPPEASQGDALTWPAGLVRLASIGRLDTQKGYDRMLRVLSHPSLTTLPWSWTIAGDGQERIALERLRDSLGLRDRVRFVGAMPAAAVLHGADLLLAPSRFEGMPLVPLEATEAGVPVLASNIAPHRELSPMLSMHCCLKMKPAWPAAIANLIDSDAERVRLRTLCSHALGNEPRQVMWDAYEALYHEAMH